MQAHNPLCRARMTTAIRGDPAEKDRLKDEDARMQHQEKSKRGGGGEAGGAGSRPGGSEQQQAKKRLKETAMTRNKPRSSRTYADDKPKKIKFAVRRTRKTKRNRRRRGGGWSTSSWSWRSSWHS